MNSGMKYEEMLNILCLAPSPKRAYKLSALAHSPKIVYQFVIILIVYMCVRKLV